MRGALAVVYASLWTRSRAQTPPGGTPRARLRQALGTVPEGSAEEICHEPGEAKQPTALERKRGHPALSRWARHVCVPSWGYRWSGSPWKRHFLLDTRLHTSTRFLPWLPEPLRDGRSWVFSPWRRACSGGPHHSVPVLKGGYEVDDSLHEEPRGEDTGQWVQAVPGQASS